MGMDSPSLGRRVLKSGNTAAVLLLAMVVVPLSATAGPNSIIDCIDAKLPKIIEPTVKFAFKRVAKLDRETNLRTLQSVLSPDGRLVANSSMDGNKDELVTVQNVATGEVLSKNWFKKNSYSFMAFVPGKEPGSWILAVTAKGLKTPLNKYGSAPRSFYLLPVTTDSAGERTLLEAPSTAQAPGSSVNHALATYPARGDPPLQQATEVSLVAGEDGVAVSQILSKPGLSLMAVIQTGGQERSRNATLFDLRAGKPLGMLEFDGRVPVRGAINPGPGSSLAAFVVENPLDRKEKNQSFLVVDLKSPQKILFQYVLPKPGNIPLHEYGRSVHNMPNRGIVSWGADGKHLFGFDANTGAMIDWDSESGRKLEASGDTKIIRPIEAAVRLRSGETLVLRNRNHARSISIDMDGYVLPPGRMDLIGPPDFTIEFSPKAHPTLLRADGGHYGEAERGRPVFELAGGKKWVIQYAHHLVVIDAKPPHQNSIFSLVQGKAEDPKQPNKFDSIVQMTEDVLRISDNLEDVFEVKIR
jgi:hypothetical protein